MFLGQLTELDISLFAGGFWQSGCSFDQFSCIESRKLHHVAKLLPCTLRLSRVSFGKCVLSLIKCRLALGKQNIGKNKCCCQLNKKKGRSFTRTYPDLSISLQPSQFHLEGLKYFPWPLY